MAEQAAKVTVTGTAKNPVFNIDIPTGAKGERGLKGDQGIIGPTPNVTVGTVVTTPNPADDVWMADIVRNSPSVSEAFREIFPTTMKGAKGDTGTGFSPTNLGTRDLNTVIAHGMYFQSGDAASTALNYPAMKNDAGSTRGTLTVTTWGNTADSITQVYRTKGRLGFTPSVEYFRVLHVTAGWSAWQMTPYQRIDNTAGKAIYTWDDTANREQLIYGDTGKRIINNLINPEFGTPPVAKLRRTLYEVELHIQLNKPAGIQGKVPILTEGLPVGFRNQHTIIGYVGGSSGKQYTVDYQGAGMSLGDMPTAAASVFIMLKYSTTDAWPTTLPGTADGSIPSL